MSNKREIKFRVWDNVDYMSTPFTLKDIQEVKIQFTSDCQVMQFTGLYDKNNTPIYEGDIDSISGGTVEFNVDTCCYVLRRPNTTFIRLDVRKDNIEIIGNIYENS